MSGKYIESIETPRLIAYFDVLGYSDYLKDDSDRNLYKSIKQIVDFTREIEKQPEGYLTKTFSDNVIIVPRLDNAAEEMRQFSHLVSFISFAHLMLLINEDLLIRGSIVHDNLMVGDNVVFGRGIVTAHEAERTASYPRTIIHESALKWLGDAVKQRKYIKVDADGSLYVDYFDGIDVLSGDTDLASGDQLSKIELVTRIRNNLMDRLKKTCNYPKAVKRAETIRARESIIAKHSWIASKFNQYCNYHNLPEYAIPYTVRMNERLMKPELLVVE